MVRRGPGPRQSLAQPRSECFPRRPSVFSPRRLRPFEGNLGKPRRAIPVTNRRSILASLLATALVVGSAGGVSAQMPPYTAYGMGLLPTDTVTATIEGVECGSARVSVAGNWKLSIPVDAPCDPKDGAIIHFAVNGKEHAVVARWSSGGAPLNPRVGVVLGAATATPSAIATPKATATASKAPTTKATPKPTPKPPAKKSPTRPAFR